MRKMKLHVCRGIPAVLLALTLGGAEPNSTAFAFSDQTRMDVAAWDAYAMALASGGREGYDLLVLSVAIGGHGGQAAAEQLLRTAPRGEELDYVMSVLMRLWKENPADHRLPVLALDLAAHGGGSPLVPEIWKALAEACDHSRVMPGELWKLWSCGVVCCSCGYASPAFYERLICLLKDDAVPLEFRLEIAADSLNACEKAILFRQLAGEPADLELRALDAARILLGGRIAENPAGILPLLEHGGAEFLRAFCRNPKNDPVLRAKIAAVLGEIAVLEAPEIASCLRPDVLRHCRIIALTECGRYADAEALLKNMPPEDRIPLAVSIERRRGNYREIIRLLQANRQHLKWESYCGDLLRAAHHCHDRATFEALRAEEEKRFAETGKPVSPESFNNFFYVGLELGLYDGKLTPSVLEQLEELPPSAESLDTFAWALYHLKNYEKAEAIILQALRLANMRSVSVILEHAGDVAAASGNWAAAERRYRLALLYNRSKDSELSPACAKKQAEALRKSKAAPAIPPKGGQKK